MPVSLPATAGDPDVGYAGDSMPSRFDVDPVVDQRLVADVLLGDGRASRRLADRTGPVIRAAASRVPRDIREDVIQDVWVHLSDKNWRVLQKWDGRGPLAHYIFVVARHHTMDRLRRAGRRELAIDDLPELPAEPVEAGNPEGQMLERERMAERAKCVNRAKTCLSDSHREMISLRHDSGLKLREMAERLNKTIGYVSGTLARAERALADKILELCGDHIGGLAQILRRRAVE
jgi:RNA polymerase sigma factor (sigma-70 family)